MSDVEATVSSRRRFPFIWLVPIVALLLGIWMVVYTFMTEGPRITIVFSTAEGIEAGKTKLKALNVEVGVVEEVTLNRDLASVSVVAKLDREARPLLRNDTRFWVVRPRFGAGGISGLGTVMSGAYIEVEPGPGRPSDRREFVGLDDLPVTPVGTPGLRLILVSSRAGSVGPGDPLLYRGYAVGRVEETVFDPEMNEVKHSVFIDAPYDVLVNKATRFWNASGISVRASTEGLSLDIGSIQTLLVGGVAFAVPEGRTSLGSVKNGVEFTLYENYESTLEEKYEYAAEYVVSFTQSIRGLIPGAPVEYRGVRVGTVREILLEDMKPGEGTGQPIPVLISIEPGRMKLGDTAEATARFKERVAKGVGAGFRASLESGNLLTGRLYVSVNFYPEEPPGEIGSFAGYPTLPTMPGGLQRIERQVSQLLAHINDLPLDATVRELNATLAELRRAVGNEEFQRLPASLNASLTKLDRTLQSVEELARTVAAQPSSLLFSVPVGPDPEPRGGP